MPSSGPNRRPHGNFITGTGGYRAFVPAALPPTIVWNETLAVSLSAADRSIGRLAGEGRHLSNPHLLIRPFIRKEAVLSSRIEGTQASLGELLAAEAGAAVERSPADLHEVGNYVVALEYGLRRLDSLPLSLRLVRELHERLMRGVRGDISTPGEFRRSQNWIGRPGSTLEDATYVPPPPAELMDCLAAWERHLHDESIPPLVHAALIHAQFEAIHPFLDGNGRVGRLLITLLMVQRDVLPSPLLYLSAYFERTRQDYYARLLGITERGEWEEWLVYFLTGVAAQSDDAIERIQQRACCQAGSWSLSVNARGCRSERLSCFLRIHFGQSARWPKGWKSRTRRPRERSTGLRHWARSRVSERNAGTACTALRGFSMSLKRLRRAPAIENYLFCN